MALKGFIKVMGLALLVLAALAILVVLTDFLRLLVQGQLGWMGWLSAGLGLGILGVVALAGWRMFRIWNESTIAEFAFLQAALAGYVLACVLYPVFPGLSGILGVIFFLVMARKLKSFTIRFLRVPGDHSRRATP